MPSILFSKFGITNHYSVGIEVLQLQILKNCNETGEQSNVLMNKELQIKKQHGIVTDLVLMIKD